MSVFLPLPLLLPSAPFPSAAQTGHCCAGVMCSHLVLSPQTPLPQTTASTSLEPSWVRAAFALQATWGCVEGQERSREVERGRERSREVERSRERGRGREVEGERERSRERSRERERERERESVCVCVCVRVCARVLCMALMSPPHLSLFTHTHARTHAHAHTHTHSLTHSLTLPFPSLRRFVAPSPNSGDDRTRRVCCCAHATQRHCV